MPGLGKSGTSRINRFRSSIGPRRNCTQLRFDLKWGVGTNVGFLLVHSLHVGPLRTAMKLRGELRELLFGTGGVYFHAAVGEVADIAGEPQLDRSALREVTESDALNEAAHQPPPGRLLSWG